MDKKESIENLITLRDFLRTIWKSYATSMITLDNLMHNNLNLDDTNYLFISKESIAYNFLTSTRAFIRTAEKISKKTHSYHLLESNKNLNKEFPDHKNTRDIIEHFDEYAYGKDNLQKNGQELVGNPLNVYLDDRNIVIIRIYNLYPLDISKLAYWIDWHMSQLEESLHKIISPNVEWKGFNPHRI